MNKYLIFSNITHNIIGSDALKKGANKAMSVIVYFSMYYVIKPFQIGLYWFIYFKNVYIHVHERCVYKYTCTYTWK